MSLGVVGARIANALARRCARTAQRLCGGPGAPGGPPSWWEIALAWTLAFAPGAVLLVTMAVRR